MVENSVTVFERNGVWVVSIVDHGETQEKEFLEEESARAYAAGRATRTLNRSVTSFSLRNG